MLARADRWCCATAKTWWDTRPEATGFTNSTAIVSSRFASTRAYASLIPGLPFRLLRRYC